jgi:lipoprotein signal peptidase
LSKYIAAKAAAIFRNYNFAFSVTLPVWLMYVYYFLILIVIGWYVRSRYRTFSGQEKIAWVLISAGALSNIGERLVLGYVRDFIYFGSGVFNIADFYILLGIGLLLFRPKIAKSV